MNISSIAAVYDAGFERFTALRGTIPDYQKRAKESIIIAHCHAAIIAASD